MTGRPRLVLVAGPIAVGKSAVAAALGALLRAEGQDVAVVGLDELAAMALPTLPGWSWAADVHARTVRAWLDAPLTTVVAEGPGTPDEIDGFLATQPLDVVPFVVLLHSDFRTALARPTADPTRGISRDPGFLRGIYDRFDADRPRLRHDLALNSTSGTAAGLAEAIAAHVRG